MGDLAEEEQQLPLVRSLSSPDASEESIERTGTIWTALAHIITGVIGAGVLSLAWSTAQLGWIAGPLCILAFAGVTVVSSTLLADCYRYPDPEFGHIRIRSYIQAVKFYLGDKSKRICVVLAQESLWGTGITYTMTTATSVRFKCRLLANGSIPYVSIKGCHGSMKVARLV